MSGRWSICPEKQIWWRRRESNPEKRQRFRTLGEHKRTRKTGTLYAGDADSSVNPPRECPAPNTAPNAPRIDAVRGLAAMMAHLAAGGDLAGVEALQGALAALLRPATAGPLRGHAERLASASPPGSGAIIGAGSEGREEHEDRGESDIGARGTQPRGEPRARIDVVTDIAVARARREGRRGAAREEGSAQISGRVDRTARRGDR